MLAIYKRKRSGDYNGLKIIDLGITTHLEQGQSIHTELATVKIADEVFPEKIVKFKFLIEERGKKVKPSITWEVYKSKNVWRC